MRQKKYVARSLMFLWLVMMTGLGANKILNTNVRKYDTTAAKDADGSRVLIFGSSQGANGINPLDMWEEAGLETYNFCGNGQYIGITCYVMEDVLKRQSPKVVVLDMESLTRPEAFLTPSNILYNLPSIADVKLRYKAYREFVEDSLVYMVPLFRYHNRWKELGKGDAMEEVYVLGAQSRLDIQTDHEDLPWIPPLDSVSVGEREQGYLNRIRELAAEKGCELILLDMPSYCDEEAEKKTKWAEQWARDQGIKFCRANSPEAYELMELTPKDFADDFHVNRKGARKVSAYVADWLAEQCGLSDGRMGESDVRWEEAAASARKTDAVSWLCMAREPEEFTDALLQCDAVTAISLTGEYRRQDERLWPVLEKCGMTWEQYQLGGAFVIGRQGELLFDSKGLSDYSWTKALFYDDLAVRGLGGTCSLLINRGECTRVTDGVNFLVYDCMGKKVGTIAGFDAFHGLEIVK